MIDSVRRLLAFACLLWVLLCSSAWAQGSPSLYEIDSSGYPTIRAKLLAVDGDGRPLSGLSSGDIRLTENGQPRTVTDLSCPSPQPLRYSSSVLTVDISESMYNFDWDLALSKYGATSWIEGLALGQSNCAITTFGDNSYINQDLTASRAKLLSAVDRLAIAPGGTNFDVGFTDARTGTLTIAGSGRQRRVVLFITDGKSDGDEGRIVAAAARAGVTVYAIVVTREAPSILRNVAMRTGGRWFDKITTREQMKLAIRTILNDVQGGAPCDITWQSGPDCSVRRNVAITVRGNALAGSAVYNAPVATPATLRVDPAAIRFGRVIPGQQRDTIITITAAFAPITISGLSSSSGVLVIDSIGTPPPPFTLQPGESRRIKVRFVPVDSGSAFARLTLQSDACAEAFAFASGGLPGTPPAQPSLKVLFPDGGERLAVGESVDLWWSGVLPDDPVSLEYSIDGGANWLGISARATGYGYRWDVPNTPSDRCLLRATALPTDSVLVVYSAPWAYGFLPDGGRVMVDGMRRLIDPVTGSTIQRFDSVDGTLIGFSADGLRVAFETGSSRLHVREVSSGILLDDLPIPAGARILKENWDYYMPSVALGGANEYEMRELKSGKLLFNFPLDFFIEFRLSRDAKFILYTGGPNQIVREARPGGSIDSFAIMRQIEFCNGANTLVARYDSSFDDTNNKVVAYLVRFWDLSARKFVRNFSLGTSRDYKQWEIPKNIYASDNGDRIATAHDDYIRGNGDPWRDPAMKFLGQNIVVWDAITGTRWKTLHIPSASDKLSFSPDGRYLAISCNDSTAIIWDLEAPSVQSDQSDSLWAIEMPRYAVGDLHLGRALVGTAKDSIVADALTNTSTVPLHIEQVRIVTGAGTQPEFALAASAGPFDIPAGGSQSLAFTFAPSAVGDRSATLEILTRTGTSSVPIRGVGVMPQLSIVPSAIDFGAHELGAVKDTVLDMLLRNVGDTSVTITDVAVQGPGLTQFSILDGGGGFTLGAGEGRRVSLRFAPSLIGRTSGRLAFIHDGVGSPSSAYLYGQGLGGTVIIPNDSGRPGDAVDLPLLLDGPRKYIGQSGATAFEAELRFKAGVLLPRSSGEGGTIADGQRSLRVRGSWSGSSDTLAYLRLRVGLSDMTSTDVDLVNFVWLGGDGRPVAADMESQSGMFDVIELCETGEPRLITGTGGVGLKQSTPNPAGSRVTIDYDVIEDGATRLVLSDLLGRSVRVLVDGVAHPGHYSLEVDVSEVAPGIYFYTLYTPTSVHTRRMEILR